MNHKLFIRCSDGKDEKRIIFDTKEEKGAFEKAIVQLENDLKLHEAGSIGKLTLTSNVQTTLQCQVLNDHIADAKYILGLNVLNVFSKDNIIMIKY